MCKLRELNNNLTELFGKALYNFDLDPQEATVEQLTGDAWVQKYQGGPFSDKPWDYKIDLESVKFKSQVDSLAAAVISYLIDKNMVEQ